MKKLLIFFVLIFITQYFIIAQEQSLLDIDKDNLDSIFDAPPLQEPQTPPVQETPPSRPPAVRPPAQAPASVLGNVRRRGIELDAAYEFRGAVNPGWEVYPWELDGDDHFSWAIGVRMRSTMGINAQVSDVFRVRSVIRYDIPAIAVTTTTTTTNNVTNNTTTRTTSTAGSVFTLGDFFFDYNFYDTVFLRCGKFRQTWGHSSNYRFTNLLSRIPEREHLPVIGGQRSNLSGPSYVARFDIPIGVGGLQLLALTRVDVAGGLTPTRDEIGFGAKYNLAFKWADFNFGAFDQYGMPTRGFLTTKTSYWDTDFYNEWLVAVNTHTDNAVSYAFNFGFNKVLFDNKLDLNGEIFNNGEGRTYFFRPETDFQIEGDSRFPEGLNFAFNVLYRAGGNWNTRVFGRFRYGEQSFSFTPGVRITPFPHTEVYFAVPMAIGDEKSYYREESVNVKNEPRPLSVLMYFTFRGSVRARYNY